MPSVISPPPTVQAKDFAPTSTTPQKRKIIIFSDFDGTISLQETGHHLLFDSRYGCGERKRTILDEQIKNFLGEEQSGMINVVANEVVVDEEEGKWKAVWKDMECEMGCDKVKSIHYTGDCVYWGWSCLILPAAREADVLFARKGTEVGRVLLLNMGLSGILEGILREDEEKTGGKGRPVRFNPRANMWRRMMSSRNGVERFVVMSPMREDKMFFVA
ncbi:hypothetical protein QBC38DRAFT_511145 [Podospora fimiseda]|uniref:Phosphatase n=1 Tax=Podospora fimiseda TaxID=252190 RepID=A0AAN7BKQ2_9PEZI|nr:hypothetical protein QBC38DRAFT_511145 [Podospora fimiseda]